jgi:hypothetical protein
VRFEKWRVEGDLLLDPDGVPNALIFSDLPAWRRARLIDYVECSERRAADRARQELIAEEEAREDDERGTWL